MTRKTYRKTQVKLDYMKNKKESLQELRRTKIIYVLFVENSTKEDGGFGRSASLSPNF